MGTWSTIILNINFRPIWLPFTARKRIILYTTLSKQNLKALSGWEESLMVPPGRGLTGLHGTTLSGMIIVPLVVRTVLICGPGPITPASGMIIIAIMPSIPLFVKIVQNAK